MAVPTFILNNTEIGGPQEWQGTEVELSLDSESPTASVTTGQFSFMGDSAKILNQWIEDGYMFEGCPYTIKLDNEVLFDGYVDLANDSVELSGDVVVAPIVEVGSIEWLNDIADSFTMESLLMQDGIIQPEDLIDLPYVISEVPDYGKAFTAFLSAYILIKDIEDLISDLKKASAKLSSPKDSPANIIEVIFLSLKLAFTITMIILLVKQMVSNLIQPLKYHKGMYVKTMLERSCEKLNLELKSPELFDTAPYDKLFVLPKKYTKGRIFRKRKKSKKRGTSGLGKLEDLIIGQDNLRSLDTGAMPKTFGDVIRDIQTMFKAKVHIIKQPTGKDHLYIVPDSYQFTTSTFQLDDVYSEFSGTNAGELTSNYEILYTLDSSEYNTLDDFNNFQVQVITKPKITQNTNPQFRLMKGLETAQIPYARAIRKEDFTFIEVLVNLVTELAEKVVKVVLQIYNGIISVVNGLISALNGFLKLLNAIIPPLLNATEPIPLVTKIKKVPVDNLRITLKDRRRGALLLSQDQFSIDKIMVLNEDVRLFGSGFTIDDNSAADISPYTLYRRFHKQATSFIPSTELPNARQYFTYSVENHPFCLEDYQLLRRNKNRILNASGELTEIESLKWNIFTNSADISYKVNRKYTDNLSEEIIADGKYRVVDGVFIETVITADGAITEVVIP